MCRAQQGESGATRHEVKADLRRLQQLLRIRLQQSWHRRLQPQLQRPMPLKKRPVAYGELGVAVAHKVQSLQRMQAPRLRLLKGRRRLRHRQAGKHTIRSCQVASSICMHAAKRHNNAQVAVMLVRARSLPTSASMATATSIVLLMVSKSGLHALTAGESVRYRWPHSKQPLH